MGLFGRTGGRGGGPTRLAGGRRLVDDARRDILAVGPVGFGRFVSSRHCLTSPNALKEARTLARALAAAVSVPLSERRAGPAHSRRCRRPWPRPAGGGPRR